MKRGFLSRLLDVERLVRGACMFGLFAMALMAWSVLDPTPFPVMVAMSVGQVVGTLSLLCYIGAVLLQGKRQRAALAKVAEQPKH